MNYNFTEYVFEDCAYCQNCYVAKCEAYNTQYECKKGIHIDFIDSNPVLQPVPMHSGALTDEELHGFENGTCIHYKYFLEE